MKKTLIVIAALAAAAALLPALAGEGHCQGTTQECLDKMVSKMQNKGFIGVDGEWDEEAEGYRISSFFDDSPADEAGVKSGDLLVAVNGIPLSDKEGSYADEANRRPGSTVKLTLMRGGNEKHVKVELIRLNEEQIAKIVGQHLMNDHTKVAMANE